MLLRQVFQNKILFYLFLFILGWFLTFISLPNAYLHSSIVAWVSFIPLFYLILSIKSHVTAFIVSVLFFKVTFISLLWIDPWYYPEKYDSLVAFVTLIGFYILIPLGYAIIFFLSRFIKRWEIILPSSLVLYEWSFSIIPGLFPISIAISQYKLAEMIQLSEWFGMYFTTFSIAYINSHIYLSMNGNKRHFYKVFVYLIVIYVVGLFMLEHDDRKALKKINIILLQTNLDWKDAYYAYPNNIFFNKIFLELKQILLAVEDTGDICIFPELTFNEFIPNHEKFDQFLTLLDDKFNYTILGASYHEQNASLVFKNKQLIDYSFKQKYIPFFERHEKRSYSKSKPLSIDNYYAGIMVCYDLLFPKISRQLILNKANFLGVISFTSWLSNPNWSYLHSAYTVFRAIENRRDSFYLNNNGPSMFIDRFGKIKSYLPMNVTGYSHQKLSLLSKKTIFNYCGNSIIISIIFINIFLQVIYFRKKF